MSTKEALIGRTEVSLEQKWQTLLLLALAELLGMATWFSASAVVPALTEAWHLSEASSAWLTMSVQIGFVLGALGSAVFTLADRIPARLFFAATAVLAGLATGVIPLANSFTLALPLRVLTGAFLAGVYPVGMKIMATWTKEDRGLAIGLLVGALTLGSAAPHLLNAFGGVEHWQRVLYLAAGLAILGGVIAALFIREGPYRGKSPHFDWGHIGDVLRDGETVLANLGYLGHMWELYAVWAWVPVFLLNSFELTDVNPRWASVAAFAAIGVGSLGSLIAGQLADRLGRTTITIGSLLVSGSCALFIGQLFGGNPMLLVAVTLIWGFAVVADSAQFSTCVSELCKPKLTGTALTLQTSLGFLLTLVTIRLVPTLRALVGWEWAFSFLVVGPAMGIWAMYTLRQSPAARQLAGGRR